MQNLLELPLVSHSFNVLSLDADPRIFEFSGCLSSLLLVNSTYQAIAFTMSVWPLSSVLFSSPIEVSRFHSRIVES